MKKSPPGNLVLNHYKGKKGPVPFPHSKHTQSIGCRKCHHVGETDSTCISCHKKKGGDAPNLKKAFHKNCTPCHKDHLKKNPESTIPTKCNTCHQ